LLIARRGFAGTGRKGWLAWIGSCLERNSQRRALSELDDHLLKDIGITRLQALKEAGKPAWHA
jgi:uncharacterized protein YjiS (DUF1127 family)